MLAHTPSKKATSNLQLLLFFLDQEVIVYCYSPWSSSLSRLGQCSSKKA